MANKAISMSKVRQIIKLYTIPSKWHEIIVEQTIAEAILDRIVHDAHRIEIKGDSLRKKKQPKSEENIESIILKN